MLRVSLFTFISFLCSLFLTASTSERSRKSSAKLSVDEKPFLSEIEQVTFDGLRSGEGYFSKNGKEMVFQSERQGDNPFYQIYLMNLASGETQKMSPGIGKTTCAWIHPSGDKVLYASTHEDPDAIKKQEDEFARRASGEPRNYSWEFDEFYELYETDGSTQVKLTDAKGYDAEGSWSPDGSKIVFASNRRGYSDELSAEEQEIFKNDPSYMMDIFIMDADGSNVKQLTTARGYDGGPFFSPDGKRITWRHFSEDGRVAEVYTMNVDGSDARQITHLGKMSWAPFYHPSGDYLIFATNVHGHANFELYLVDVNGTSEPVRVTSTDGFDGLPVFLPNGRELSWTSNRGGSGSSQIFSAKWNDLHARRVLGLNPLDATSGAIDEADLRMHIEYLASDELEGRMTGTKGEELATKYVADSFKHNGLEGFFGPGKFFQEFSFNAGVSLGTNNRFEIYEINKDWRPLAFSQSGAFESQDVVFGGYGIVAPASGEFEEYNSYVHLDVTDKWVLVFRFLPENLPVAHKQYLHRFSELRHKAMVARNLGAKGLIVVSGPNSQVQEQLVPLKLDVSSAGVSIDAVTVTDDVGAALIASGTELSLKAIQDKLDAGEFFPGFDLKRKVSGQIDIAYERRTGRNVVARLSSSHNAKGAVIIGAHVDHLGKDEHGIYHGADDNASGVAGVLELAQFFADLKARGELNLPWDLVFATWSGEELGLLGSAAFAKKISEDGALYPKISAVLNMDMVGRLKRSLILQGAGSSSLWPKLIERFSATTPISVVMGSDPYLPTDSTSFYLQGVPTLNAFTESHADYHTPSDTADKINYRGTKNVVTLMGKILQAVAESPEAPDYISVENPNHGGGGFRVYLGTIPDYANENVVGVLLAGVKPGSPAEQAGLKTGDVIVSLAGQKIENVYDYTYVLGVLKVGEEVEIVVKREAQTISLKVIPAPRSKAR